ncbi:DUF21 domain-containing protein At2g14520-like [Silene latifolia]|uniref:DUF21 domain-containing protein At2g14520-like n=1 Tax=Silene latifolia TaxID=37657 RepID=UPI003D780E70
MREEILSVSNIPYVNWSSFFAADKLRILEISATNYKVNQLFAIDKKILPVVKNQHLLLCTLLICNAAAMETLPTFLDSFVTAWGAILISVTLILLFDEIMPQSLCSRYGLAIGATVAPFVRVLVWICFPIAYPISKVLDLLLGHGHKALFRRAELKTLVNLHGNEAGKSGELTHDETTIIAGALELTEKTAGDAMTPIADIFSIDINGKLDRDLMNSIMDNGHSRIPVYYEEQTNIIGCILMLVAYSILNGARHVFIKNRLMILGLGLDSSLWILLSFRRAL